MYRYDEFDATLVRERIAQFRDQIARRLSGELTEAQFEPLRLMNGVYLQLHAYMLRVAIPYGSLNSAQLCKLAEIARKFDRGYGHFTTRQNIQFNWIRLADMPAVLEALAEVEMHAIQTSGNCIRNVTADHLAGAAADEIEDPRPWAEIIRQWSTLHPEFSFLPRKFKIAVAGAEEDRAAARVHDIGLQILRNAEGEAGFEVIVGGGLGRTPHIGATIREFLPREDLLSYLEAILRVYNRFGRRDNIYKARIKILVDALGAAEFARQVEAEWREIRDGALKLPEAEIARIRAYFEPPEFERLEYGASGSAERRDARYRRWREHNVHAHRQPGYVSVTASLKAIGAAPGDASAEQLEVLAHVASRYGHDEARVSHEQNVVFPHIPERDLYAVWRVLDVAEMATPNIGLISDIVACPGLDYCKLANARAIPIAQAIAERFSDPARQEVIGKLRIKISGCINACGHHHVGHIGILGVDKKGEEFYQITLGGRAGRDARIGAIAGRGLRGEEIPDAVERLADFYLKNRSDANESFIEALDRIGRAPFTEALYAA